MKKIEKSTEIGGRKLTLATGHVAAQADGAVMATYGETVVLATVVSQPLAVDLGYFPLTVEYMEKLYAGGKIKGSRWVKREGRPTDEEILSARLIDRSIRPLFPKEYSGRDVQVVVTVLSVDMENRPDIVGAIAVSAAIAISPIPWNGPIGITRVGLKDGNHLVNPVETDIDTAEMDLIVSSNKDAVVMIEAGAKQVSEKDILKGIDVAQKESERVIKLINDLVTEVKTKKVKVEKKEVSKDLYKKIKKDALVGIVDMIPKLATKEVGYSAESELKKAVLDTLEDKEKAEGTMIFEDIFQEEVRNLILSGKRPDGRKHDQLRQLSAEVGVLPRTHGSALFQRGQTQAMTIATLGAPSLEQLIETATGEESKRYIHHYSMPPFSSGETGRMGSPNRREIGHGALAERALLSVIPGEDVFHYTIRVVTEILSSNGSTSMASVCGSTLSLMDAGVPIVAPVAGIAMGLIVESAKKYAVLTDIVGLEDGYGDMDFKVAGTKDGVTAMQLDVKSLNLTLPILEAALAQAKVARLEILKVITDAIDAPRASVSKYAPKIKIIRIAPDKIGELIGPGGKTIKRIIAETGAQVDVDDDGSVFVSAVTSESLENGIARIEAITKVPLAGEIYEGTVKRMQSFGAFVEILPGKEGLVHVSDMSENFVKDPAELIKLGDEVQVRVKGIDELGRLNLSMMLDPGFDARKEEKRKDQKQGGNRYFDRKPRQGGQNKYGDRDKFRERGGPHFPTSRFLDKNTKKY